MSFKEFRKGRRLSLSLCFTTLLLSLSSIASANSVDSYHFLGLSDTEVQVDVASYVDSNSIDFGDKVLHADASEVQTSLNVKLKEGQKISGTGPFQLALHESSAGVLVPSRYAHTDFIIPHRSGTQTYLILSPSYDAEVTVSLNGEVSSHALEKSQVEQISFSSEIDTSLSISSNTPILVAKQTNSVDQNDSVVDGVGVIPPANQLWGIAQQGFLIAASQDDTNVTISTSRGEKETFTLNAGDVREVSNDEVIETQAVKVTSTKPVSVLAFSTQDQEQFFVPHGDLGTRHTLIAQSNSVVALCVNEVTRVTISTQSGEEARSCYGNGGNPGLLALTSGGEGLAVGTRIESDSPVYLSVAKSALTERASVTKTALKSSYFALGLKKSSRALQILSLEGGNRISLDDVSLNLNKYQLGEVPAGAVSPGDEIVGSRPFDLSLNGQGNLVFVHSENLGRAFVVPAMDSAGSLFVLSPDFDTTLTVWSKEGETRHTLSAGIVKIISTNAARPVVLESSSPIALAYQSDSGQSGIALSPVANELWGAHTGNTVIAAYADNTTVTVHSSDGAEYQYQLNKGEQTQISKEVDDRNVGLYVAADHPVMAFQATESGAMLPFSSARQLSNIYGLPVDASSIGIVCTEDDATIKELASGAQPQTHRCSRVKGARSGLADISANGNNVALPAGTVIESSEPVHLYFESASSAEEKPLTGSRKNPDWVRSPESQPVLGGQREVGLGAIMYSMSSSAPAPSLNAVTNPVSSNPFPVSGTATANTEVRLYVSGVLQTTVAADGSGAFTANLVLADGVNAVTAAEWDGTAEGAMSSALNVDYQNTIVRDQSGATISQDIVWTPGSPATPYLVTTGDLTVAPGATLTLAAGTEIRFGSGKKLVVNGQLDIQGTSANHVVLTSSIASPTFASWIGVWLKNTATTHDWSYLTVEYANQGIQVSNGVTLNLTDSILRNSRTGIQFQGGSGGLVERCDVVDNQYYGVEIMSMFTNTSPAILNNQILRTTGYGGYYQGYGIRFYGPSDSLVQGNTITGNLYGINAGSSNSNQFAKNPAPKINGNDLSGNSKKALQVGPFAQNETVTVDATGNWWGTVDPAQISESIFDFSDQSTSAPFVNATGFLDGPPPSGQVVQGNFLQSLVADGDALVSGTPYLVMGDLYVPANATLNIQAGATIKFGPDAEFIVDGEIGFQGSSSSQVVLTSQKSTPEVSDWKGIRLNNEAVNHSWDHLTIEYASEGIYVEDQVTLNIDQCALRFNRVGIKFDPGSDGSVTQCVIEDNRDYGIHIQSNAVVASPTIQNNQIVRTSGLNGSYYGYAIYFNGQSNSLVQGNELSNNLYGVYMQGHVNLQYNPTPSITGNNFFNNSRYNLYALSYNNAAQVQIDASGNWWGTTDVNQISSKVYDHSDNPNSSPHVDYTGFVDGSLPGGQPIQGNYLTSLISNGTVLQSSQTYKVLGSITIPSAASLTIQAGAKLEFTDNAQVAVDGELNLQGTSANPVIFTSQNASPAISNWKGIRLNNTSVPHNWSHIQVEYAKDGIYVEDGVTLNLTDCVLRSNYTGIKFDPGTGGSVERCLIEDNSHFGIHIWAVGAPVSPTIKDNQILRTFRNYYGHAIDFYGPSNSIVQGNQIAENQYGIFLRGQNGVGTNPTPAIAGNDIYNNTRYSIYATSYHNSASVQLDVTGNWWGTVSISEISGDIYDFSELPASAPHIDFSGFLDGPSSGGQPVGGNHLPSLVLSGTVLQSGETYSVLGDLSIPSGIVLTIEAGARLEFVKNAEVLVDGEIIFQAATSNPVVFTSQAATPAISDWRGIKLSNTTAAHDWHNVTIEYAKEGVYVENDVTLNLSNCKLQSNQIGVKFGSGTAGKVENCYIQDNEHHGIYVEAIPNAASPSIIGNQILRTLGRYYGYGVYIYGKSTSLIQGNHFFRNKYGIQLKGRSIYSTDFPTPTINGNNFLQSQYSALTTGQYKDPSLVTVDARSNWWGSVYPSEIALEIYDFSDSPNNLPHVDFSGYLNGPLPGGQPVSGDQLLSLIQSNTTLVANTTYTVLSDLFVASGATLTLPQGVRLEFAKDAEFLVEGQLDLQGTSTNPVVMTSQSATPKRRDWKGIRVKSAQSQDWSHFKVEYADLGVFVESGFSVNVVDCVLNHNQTGIQFDRESGGKVEGCELKDNYFHGVYVRGNTSAVALTSPQIINNVIQGTTSQYYGYGIYLSGRSDSSIQGNEVANNRYGVYLEGYLFSENAYPKPVLTGNSLRENQLESLYTGRYKNASTVSIDATGNWWGSLSPAQISSDIREYGDNPLQSPQVDYSGYLDGPPPTGQPVSGHQLSSLIQSNTTLLTNETYTVLGDVFVAPGVTLTLPAGTELKFAENAEFLVEGQLDIQATDASPVVFTSQSLNPERDDWEGIVIKANQQQDISHLRVEYAKLGVLVEGGFTANLVDCEIRQNTVGVKFETGSGGKVENCQIEDNKHHGVFLRGNGTATSPQILNNRISGSDDPSQGYGLYIWGLNTSVVQGNEITGNRYGINVLSNNSGTLQSEPVVTGNSIYQNSAWNYFTGVYQNPSGYVLNATGNWWGTTSVAVIGSKIHDASDNIGTRPNVDVSGYLDGPPPAGQPATGVDQLQGIISSNTTLLSNRTYEILSDVRVPAGVTLTIQSGAVLKFSKGQNLIIEGSLDVNGALQAPVLFTGTAIQAADRWGGIFVDGGTVNIDNAIIEHAVRGIEFVNGSGSVTNSIIWKNGDGIYISRSSSPVLSGNLITQNHYGVYIRGTSNDTTNPQPQITGNDIFGNTSNWDVYVLNLGGNSNIVIDATNNWWGSASNNPKIFFHSSPNSSLDISQRATSSLRVVSMSSATLSRRYISSSVNTADFSGTLTSALPWSIEIKDSIGSSVRSFQGSTSAINISWDGLDQTGQSLSDGVYQMIVTANDGTNDVFVGGEIIVLDSTPPVAQIVSPAENETLMNLLSTDITGAAADALSFLDYSLEYGAGVSPTSWNLIYSDSVQPALNGFLSVWQLNSKGGSIVPVPNGDYTLKLTVRDQAGNATIDTAFVTVDNFNITNVSRSVDKINVSSNEDTDISFSTNFAGSAEIRIFRIPADSSSTPIRVINHSLASAGVHSVTWDGKDDQGDLVAAGGYRFTIFATDSQRQTEYDPEIETTGVVFTNNFWSVNFNIFENDHYRIGVSVPKLGLVSPELQTSHTFSSGRIKPYGDGIWLEAGSHTLNWDGLHPESGQIYIGSLTVPVINFREFQDNDILVEHDEVVISGPQNHSDLPPSVEVKTDPYLVYLSYGQFTKFHYNLDQSAQIAIKLLPPGVREFDDPRAITVINETQAAGDHEVEWRGQVSAQNTDLTLGEDGVHMFVIKATNGGGSSTTRRGVLNAFK